MRLPSEAGGHGQVKRSVRHGDIDDGGLATTVAAPCSRRSPRSRQQIRSCLANPSRRSSHAYPRQRDTDAVMLANLSQEPVSATEISPVTALPSMSMWKVPPPVGEDRRSAGCRCRWTWRRCVVHPFAAVGPTDIGSPIWRAVSEVDATGSNRNRCPHRWRWYLRRRHRARHCRSRRRKSLPRW